MERQKHPPTMVDKFEISPIEVEEDNPAKPPDSLSPGSPPPVSPLNHQTDSRKAYIDTFLTQFEDDQQPTIFYNNLYEKS